MMNIFDLQKASGGIPPLSVNDINMKKPSVDIKVSKELTHRKSYAGYSVTCTTKNGDRELFLFEQDLPKHQIKPGESGEAIVTRRDANSDLCKIEFAASHRALKAK